jgi:xanthine dehydrogenase large subunit
VLIDRFTGELKVLRSDVLMDIGRPLNPGVDRGQCVGAFVQGMGWVTTEELRYAPSGELLSHSPTTYKIPNINDLPEQFSMEWIDVENPVNIRGSKAVGEPPLLTAISIWCAVKHALGFISNGKPARLRLPATNEEILMRLTEYQVSKSESLKVAKL